MTLFQVVSEAIHDPGCNIGIDRKIGACSIVARASMVHTWWKASLCRKPSASRKQGGTAAEPTTDALLDSFILGL